MATSLYSTSLRLALPTTGDLFGTWGTEINNSITSMVDQAVAGRAVVNMSSDANYTLTALNGTSDEARCAVLRVVSGVSLTATRDVIVPTAAKLWIVENATTGSQSIQVKTAAGTGVTIPNGSTYWLRCDGTNVVTSFGYFPASLGTAALPSYTFVGDPNTGVYSPGADEWAVATAGAQRVRVNANGEAVVGASAPVAGAGFSVTKDITGATTAFANRVESTVRSGVTTAAVGYSTNIGTEAAVFTIPNLRHYQTQQATFGAGSIVTNQYGFHVGSGMTGAANNFSFRGNLTAAATSWNLYMDGTAKNYLAGNLLCGTLTENASGAKLQTADGLTFPATQVPIADPNTLDDYEEGTFLPTIIGATTAGTASYGPQRGTYTKIGHRVFYELNVAWSGHTGTGTMVIDISAIPFTPNLASNSAYVPAVYASSFTVTAGYVVGAVHNNALGIVPTQTPVGGGTPLATAMVANGLFILSGSFLV
jgi:hypothetical protein